MNERFPTDRKDWRPVFDVNKLKTKAGLLAYKNEMIKWTNAQDREVQKKYAEEFGTELAKLLKATEEPTEEQIEALHEKLPAPEQRDKLSPEALGRYHGKIKAQLANLREREGVGHKELNQKGSEYAAVFGKLNSLGTKITKLQEGEDVSNAELQSIYSELTQLMENVRNQMGGRPDRLTENENKESVDKTDHEGLGEEELNQLVSTYENAAGPTDKANAAVNLVQAEIKSLKGVIKSFLAKSENAMQQVSEADKKLSDQLNSFVTVLNTEDSPTEAKIEQLTKAVRNYLAKTNELVELQNQRYQESSGELEEFIPELQQHLGILQSSNTEVGSLSMNSLTEQADMARNELLRQIESNDNLSDEFKEKLKEQANEARTDFYNATGGLDKDGNEVAVTGQVVSGAYEKFLHSQNEIMRQVSPEYQVWYETRGKYREAKNELHAELAEIQKNSSTLRGRLANLLDFKKTQRLNEAGEKLERWEERYLKAAADYQAVRMDNLRSELAAAGKSPEEIEAEIDKVMERFETTQARARGGFEGKTIAMLEKPENLKLLEKMAPIAQAYRKIPPAARFGVGVAAIGGFAAATVVTGGGAAVPAALGLAATRGARLGLSTGFGGLVGSFTLGGWLAKRKFNKEQKKVDEAQAALNKAAGEVVSGQEKGVQSVRELIRQRNKDFWQAQRDQKIKSMRSGVVGGLGSGLAIGGGANLAFDDWFETASESASGPLSVEDMREVYESGAGNSGITEEVVTTPDPMPEAGSIIDLPDVTGIDDAPASRVAPELTETAPREDVIPVGKPPVTPETQTTGEGYSLPETEVIETETLPPVEDGSGIEEVPQKGETTESETGSVGEENNGNIEADLETLMHETVQGDWVSKKLVEFYPDHFKDLTEEQWNEFIASVEANPEVMREAGIKSGDLDLIRPGEKIRYDVLAEHYLNNVAHEGSVLEAELPADSMKKVGDPFAATAAETQPSTADIPPPPPPTPEVTPQTVSELEPLPPITPEPGPPGGEGFESGYGYGGVLEGQPQWVIDEFRQQANKSMNAAELQQLLEKVIQEGNDTINNGAEEVVPESVPAPEAELVPDQPVDVWTPELNQEYQERLATAMNEGLTPEQLAALIGMREEMIFAMEGPENAGTIAALNDVPIGDLVASIENGQLAGLLADQGVEGDRISVLLTDMNKLGVFNNADNLNGALENAIRNDWARLGGSGLQMRKVGLFGLPGGWRNVA